MALGTILSLPFALVAGIVFGRLIRHLTQGGHLGTMLSASILLVVVNHVVFVASWTITADFYS